MFAAYVVDHDGVEGLVGAGEDAAPVELGGDAGFGVVVEEAVDFSDDLGRGAADLAGVGADGEVEGGGLAGFEADFGGDVLSSRRRVTSSMRRRTMRLRSRWGVRGSDHRAGKSVASAAIRALSVSARGVARAALALVFVLGGSQGA